ncbi:MAG: hypothetical protein PHG48_06405 [Eubacteriales bacterium]|nr:hypothetical protein [Eubacteriales bacterium]
MARQSRLAALLENEILPQLQILYDLTLVLSEKLGAHSDRLDSLDRVSEELSLLYRAHDSLISQIRDINGQCEYSGSDRENTPRRTI